MCDTLGRAAGSPVLWPETTANTLGSEVLSDHAGCVVDVRFS